MYVRVMVHTFSLSKRDRNRGVDPSLRECSIENLSAHRMSETIFEVG